jgi:homoserine dehydrogenase
LARKMAVNVGVIGFGTVGTGTVRILRENASVLEQRLGFPVVLKRVADKDLKTDRGVKLPKGMLTDKVEKVLDDPDIDIVVELIGGINPAKDFILRAIANGKHVVTANKALIAQEGSEIFSAAGAKGVQLGIEAAVAGGIPIIKVMREGLVANRILSVYGIINGTANYILTKMTDEGAEFGEVLKEAQKLGYAEADPTFDVEGQDSAHKLTILASLAFGIPLSYGEVYCEGITKITPVDIDFARELGYKIKLLAIAKATNGDVELRVHPTMIPQDHLISKVDGVFNAVYVQGDAVGDTLYYGRGAGDMPTGSAIVADIADIARNISCGAEAQAPAFGASDIKVRNIEDIASMYYFRFGVQDKPGVLSKIAGILGKNEISIASVIQKGRRVGGAVPVIILTHMAREREVRQAVAEIDKLPAVSEPTFFIRVESREE